MCTLKKVLNKMKGSSFYLPVALIALCYTICMFVINITLTLTSSNKDSQQLSENIFEFEDFLSVFNINDIISRSDDQEQDQQREYAMKNFYVQAL